MYSKPEEQARVAYLPYECGALGSGSKVTRYTLGDIFRGPQDLQRESGVGSWQGISQTQKHSGDFAEPQTEGTCGQDSNMVENECF